MAEMTTMKVHEEQVTDLTGKMEAQTAIPLTKANAHRASFIRRKGTGEETVPFHFRKKCTGMHTYIHTYAEDEKELPPSLFNDWEVVEFKHPGYLEELENTACNAYHWNSFDAEERAKTDIMHYEAQLHEDLQQIPKEKQEEYISAYKRKFAALLGSLSRCANPMVTGRSNFNFRKNEKADNAYQKHYEEFRGWRERYLNAMQRLREAARPEGEKQEEAWQRLKRDIASSANTIHEIDTGKARGYSRALFVSSILSKVSTFANHGEVEIVQKAVDFITEYNASVKKPVITARNRFFQLPEVAQRIREKLKVTREQESKEVPFEGGRLVWNYEEDRLQILFDNIPQDSMRKELKSSGFRWSPRNRAWQRQLTQNAVHAAKRLLNLQNN